ncbi:MULTISPECIES: hypothetical protein [Streptomyces]|uniref:ATP-binding protein n=2 Tax=Streptomyces TaxID=1883 RepID=A0A117NXZ0_9ACTN|nr:MULTISPECIES: hypothetical protein [Streptomyces]ELS53365.1 hypothetical protein STVIR_5657 [Streptomyces viridochromogenes Tue57]KUM69441.1 hypothetical protein AQI70_32300 [Streptomyces curacoi]
MKNLKAAAVVVGSLAVAGTAGPAAAVDLSAPGLVDNGKTVARSLPAAAKLPTGYVGNNVKRTADGVKQGVRNSSVVKTPVFGGTLPNPIDGQLLGGLPVGKPAIK